MKTIGETWASLLREPGGPKAGSRTRQITWYAERAPAIAMLVMDKLDSLPPGQELSTGQLGDLLWPKSEAQGFSEERARLFNKFLLREDFMPEWKRRNSEPVLRYGEKNSYPWWWRKPVVRGGLAGLTGLAQQPTAAEQAADKLRSLGFPEPAIQAAVRQLTGSTSGA
jgi:hypothetical protein